MHRPVRLRVSALIAQDDAILLIRHEKDGRQYWMLPGGGVEPGETLEEAIERELEEECGLDDVTLAGPIAIAESIAPDREPGGRHVVHVIFEAMILRGTLELVASRDAAVRNHRMVRRRDLAGLDLRPPLQRFLERHRTDDPFVSLGRLWAP